jgi:hypothetical protein
MKACGFLLLNFLAIFLGICAFSCSCDAASPCPVRTVRMWYVHTRGYQIRLQGRIYGEQFRGKMRRCPLIRCYQGKKSSIVTLKTTFVRKTNALKMFTVSYRRALTEIQNNYFSKLLVFLNFKRELQY